MAAATIATTDIRRDEHIQRDVTAEHGVVTLTGGVDSSETKWAAEEAAHRVRGGRVVVNNLGVRLPSMAAKTDVEIISLISL